MLGAGSRNATTQRIAGRLLTILWAEARGYSPVERALLGRTTGRL